MQDRQHLLKQPRHRHGSAVGRFGLVALLALLALPASLAPCRAHAAPGIEGTRTLGLGGGGRSSATGTQALLSNPAGMSTTPEFIIDAMYQYRLEDRGHGFAIAAMDSRQSPWVAIGLSYAVLSATPRLTYIGLDGLDHQLQLNHTGHEVALGASIRVVPQWLSLAVKPKYQFTALRFTDGNGDIQSAHTTLNAFGLDVAAQLTILSLVGVGVVAENLVGRNQPAWTDTRLPSLGLTDIEYDTVDPTGLRRLSDYPRTLHHSLSVYPTRKPTFSINFDGAYDFSSFREIDDPYTRLRYGGSGELTLGPIPLRFGGYWDGRGRGKDDDRGYIAGGIAFHRPAQIGVVGFDVGFSFQRQVTGPTPETFIGVNLAVLLNPDR
ncbi:MAG: hypothetical protein ACPG77_08740 [Nannocystaceae bacterium]